MPVQSRTSSSGSAASSHFIIVSGLPQHITWKMLKDLIRTVLNNHPRWTDIVRYESQGQKGVSGYVSLKSDEDADNAYALLTSHTNNGRNLLVHHFDDSKMPAKLLRCNCPDVFPGAPNHSPSLSSIDFSRIQFPNPVPTVLQQTPIITSPPLATAYVVNAYSVAPMAPLTSAIAAGPVYPTQYLATPTTLAQAYYSVPAPVPPLNMLAYPHPQPPGPVYSPAGPNGMLVNVSNGAVMTESRGIFIGNLNYQIKQHELESLIKKAVGDDAKPIRCDINKDARTGRPKGSATALFASKEQAQLAIQKLNGKRHMGLKLICRPDKTTTTLAEPVIVNGSGGR